MTFVAYDVTRLFLGPISRTPRGIDRIDLLLAQHFFGTQPDLTVGVLPTPWGVRTYDSRRVLRGLDRLQGLWAEKGRAEDDRALHWLRSRILGRQVGPAPQVGKLTPLQKVQRIGAMIGATGFSFGRSVTASLPQGAAYLNVGQISLALEFMFRWLDRRPDVRAAMMLHDVIPLEHPDLVARTSVQFHNRMVKTTARHADGVIVTTQSAKAAILQALRREGRMDIPSLAAMLPLDPGFDVLTRPDPELASRSYFVVCGAIEPRKNLGLLLEVWRDLVARLGPETPHLAVVGTPNFRGDEILAAFAACEATTPFIHVASGLSTPGLAVLMSGARALLMPSLAEGFGLPIMEARALGCPVIASDIPAHREVMGPNGTLLPPQDVAGWAEAVLAARSATHRPARRAAAELQAARQAFVAMIEAFLTEAPQLAQPVARRAG